MRAHFVRVPGTSDVGPAARFGVPASSASCSRARTGSRSFVRSASQCNDRRRVVFSSPFFKGNETIFRRRPLFLFFSGHSGQSGHARSLTPSPADSQFRCQRVYEKRRTEYLRTIEYHFRSRQVRQSISSIFSSLSQRVQVDVSI